MSSGPEKSHTAKPPEQTRAAQGPFFRKAGEGSFFGAQETPSFFGAAVQPKLEVSQPDDPQEKEADAVADSVTRMAEPAAATPEDQKEDQVQRSVDVQRVPMAGRLSRQAGMGGFASALQSDDNAPATEVQAKAQSDRVATFIARSARGPPVARAPTQQSASSGPSQSASGATTSTQSGPPSFETSLASSKGSGSPLPSGTRESMEGRFGADFSGVRIHTGNEAQTLSGQIQAQAFTHGNDIYFNSGRFSPESSTGSHLLAHELTHTIQQGASQATTQKKAARAIQRRGIQRQIQRVEAGSQRTAAVEMAKAEQGKVNANDTGPDGKRMGWERLLEFFKITFGEDKILPEGSAFQPGCINEAQIKTKSSFVGDVMGGDGITVLHNQPRDAMPSWCGIFAFWAINKGGIPLKKWQLGASFIPPESAIPKGQAPKPGDIAWRREFSHYALVESSDGSNVVTINGNTAGEDNIGGQIQIKTHPIDHWYAFFDPTLMMDGALRAPNAPEGPAAAPARSLKELRKQMFNVDRKAEPTAVPSTQATQATPETKPAEKEEEKEKVQTKSETASAKVSTSDSGAEKEVDRAAEATQERETPEVQAAAAPPAEKEEADPSKTEDVQRAPLALHNRGPPRAPPQIQSKVNRRIQRWSLSGAWDAVSGAISEAAAWVEKGLDKAKEWMLDKVRDFVVNIPGYQMLCLILGEDPITGAACPMTGENLLEAGLQILPLGWMFKSLFMRLNIWTDACDWMQGRIEDLSNVASDIGDRFATFWDGLSLDDIGDPEAVLTRVANLLKSTLDAIIGFVERSVTSLLDMIKTVMIREVSGFIRTRIPRLYPLLCVALGFDPQTMLEVPRNGTNILNALLEFSPDGEEQKKQIRESGTFQKIAGWIDEGIAVFSTAWTLLKAAIAGIWNYVTVENLFSPVQTFTRIYDSFAEPIGMVLDYVIRAAIEILKIIKDVVIKRVSAFARRTRGFPLLCVLLGKDPFTNEVVPRTVHNVVKGFFSLMDGGEQQYDQLAQSGAIDRIIAKVEAAVERLNLTFEAIVALFMRVWNELSLSDLARPLEAFKRIVDTLAQPVFRIIRFIIEIVLIVIEAVLILMSFPFDIVANILAKARQAWALIKSDPVGFFKNLLLCVKQGFIQFFDNIGTHLINGIVGWLMTELREAGVPILTDFSLQGVIAWVLEVLGISMEKIWQKLAEHPRIGPQRVAQIRGAINTLEGIWTFIKDVQERGMAAIWDKIQEQLSNLWDKILDMVKSWIMEKIIATVVTKLLSMLDPTGIMAVINSCIAIYKAVQSFIKYITEMLRVVNAFVEGILAIAEGNIKVGADALEGALGRAMPIVIGFLANQVGLGGIGSKIAELIGAARDLVDAAITWLVNKCVDTAFAMLDRLFALGQSAVAAVRGWLGIEKKFTAEDGEEHRVYMGGSESDPVLMVASNPTAYATFIAGVEIAEDDPKKTEKTAAKTQAHTVAGQVDARKRSRIQGESEDIKKAAVQTLVDLLCTHTKVLFGNASAAGTPAVAWPETHGTFGKKMTAVRLNKANKLEGSRPTRDPNPNYAVLDQRRVIGNPESNYYVKGHLLNQTLGGKGDWENLTPLSIGGNSAHEGSVESLVKAGVESGAVVEYNVSAVYGYGSNASVIPNTDPDAATKRAIIAEEANVPRALTCESWRLEKQGTEWVRKESIVSQSVVNPIDQSAESYVLSTSTTVLDFAALKADAQAGFSAQPTETFAVWRGKDRVHQKSMSTLAPAQVGEIEALFAAHFRAPEKAAEIALANAVEATDGVPTWTMFRAGRVFYAPGDSDPDVMAVETAFNNRIKTLRGNLFTAAEAAIAGSPKGQLWRDFKSTNKLGFATVGATEEARLIKIQTDFENHQRSLP